MKKNIFSILAVGCLLTACSSDVQDPAEGLEMTFTPKFPVEITISRAESVNVNKVVCTVFENGVEIPQLRQVLEVSDNMTYTPRLIIGQTYTVAFWAMKEGAYDVSDMKSVTRAGSFSEADYDAFTATMTVTVGSSGKNRDILLRRPFARLQLGSSDADYNSATSILGYTLTSMDITVDKAYDSYNAVSGTPAGSAKPISYSSPISDGNINVNGTDFHRLAMYYVLADQDNSLTYTVKGKKGEEAETDLVTGLSVPTLTIKPNHTVNITGDLITGSQNFSISLEAGPSDDNNNQSVD